jgi:chromosomal replication initiator protein
MMPHDLVAEMMENERELLDEMARHFTQAAAELRAAHVLLGKALAEGYLPARHASGSRLQKIDEAIQRQYGFTRRELRHESRKQPFVEARQLAMWLTRKTTRLSLPGIGERFARDHTTVLHAVRRVEGWSGSRAAIRDELYARVLAESGAC